MPRNIYVDVDIDKNLKTVDVNIGKKSNVDVDINIDPSTGGKVPPFGLEGQVLTKTTNSYAWKSNPIQVDTFNDLPTEPSSQCLYLVKDTLKLVFWDGYSWNELTGYEILYDDEEEMMYIE